MAADNTRNQRIQTPEIQHSGDLGLERPVREFDKTPLDEAVDRGLVGPASEILEHLHPKAPEVFEPEPQPSFIQRHRKGLGLTAAASLFGGGVAYFATNGSNSSEKTDATTSEQTNIPQTAVSPTPNTSETTSPESQQGSEGLLPKDLLLPVSDDPQSLTGQLYSNYANFLNTGDERYLKFEIISTTSGLGEQAYTARQNSAPYLSIHPGTRYVSTTSVDSSDNIDNPTFTPQDTQRVVVVKVNIKLIDNSGNTLQEFQNTDELTLKKVTRYKNEIDRADPVDVWLISYLQTIIPNKQIK